MILIDLPDPVKDSLCVLHLGFKVGEDVGDGELEELAGRVGWCPTAGQQQPNWMFPILSRQLVCFHQPLHLGRVCILHVRYEADDVGME